MTQNPTKNGNIKAKLFHLANLSNEIQGNDNMYMNGLYLKKNSLSHYEYFV
jgi:hypothetical protein